MSSYVAHIGESALLGLSVGNYVHLNHFYFFPCIPGVYETQLGFLRVVPAPTPVSVPARQYRAHSQTKGTFTKAFGDVIICSNSAL